MKEHPNISLLKRLDLRNLEACADLFHETFAWHYFNPKWHDVSGDYDGLQGLQTFFEVLGSKSGGTINLEPVSITACGDELVVTHVRNSIMTEDQSFAVDAVEVWRVVDGRLAEGWDIPAVHVFARKA